MKQYDPVKLQSEVRKAVDALLPLNRAVNLEGENPSPFPSFMPSDYG
ncbi:MAG: hypothetical protein LBV17_06735 [Treponema sp.]|jgi:hypothetical protein|nr:hypothetical protein [Treponema sp.]